VNLFENLLSRSLKIQPGESIGLIHDFTFRAAAQQLEDYCVATNVSLQRVEIGYTFGQVIPDDAKKFFLDDYPPIVVLGLRENMWHSPERKVAKYVKRKRVVNLLNPDGPCSSFAAPIETMVLVGSKLEELLHQTRMVHIFTEAGTSLTAEVGTVFCETGDYSRPGTGGDFPAGEVGFGPVERSVSGTVVYDLKIQHVGFVRQAPHRVVLVEDIASPVNCSDEYRRLVASHPSLNYISEISFGINSVIAEEENSQSIVEEKNIGTCHFGSGGNLSYGNRKGPHFDGVIMQPTVFLDGQLLMRNGVFNQDLLRLT